MKNIYHFILFLFIATAAKAQQQYPTTINSGGNYSSNGGVMLEYSVGGLVVTTMGTPSFMYTQGFLQPDAGSTTVIPHINDVVLNSGSGIDNAGTTFINGGIMLEFTTGEFASITHITASNMLTQGILQPYNASGGVLPVTGLDLVARRTDANTVVLDWKTLQEFNNKGFHVERKYENESSFTGIAYVATAAPNGNSSFLLSYQRTDNNSFTGKTFYRIKQEDIDGRNTYSAIRVVNGMVNDQIKMKVWPIPATGPVNVLVNGLANTDMLLVFDISGRLIKQQAIQNNVAVKLSNLTPGTYILKLTENKDLIQKLVVQ
jgi:hypothetical protein